MYSSVRMCRKNDENRMKWEKKEKCINKKINYLVCVVL